MFAIFTFDFDLGLIDCLVCNTYHKLKPLSCNKIELTTDRSRNHVSHLLYLKDYHHTSRIGKLIGHHCVLKANITPIVSDVS